LTSRWSAVSPSTSTGRFPWAEASRTSRTPDRAQSWRPG
jgi:hypothetical protein